jgi:hypothetical protein
MRAMAGRPHDARWPDKAMFAALLLLVAGALGTLHGVLEAAGATFGDSIPAWLRAMPTPFVLLGSIAAALLGLVALRTQRSLFALLGALAAVASTGLFGIVSALGLLSLGFLALSRREDEPTRGEGRIAASAWPDKAMAASLFLVVAAAVALFQAVALMAGRLSVPILPDAAGFRWGLGLFDLLAAAAGIAAAREVYLLRRPWLGWTAGILLVASAGLYLLAPLAALVALLLLDLARREGEFRAAARAGHPGA